MKYAFFIVGFVLFCSAFAKAQVSPPIFQCVLNDSLFWAPVSNSCGPFVSVDIFASDMPNGPFTLEASVTDPNQQFYFDASANGQLTYYYLVNNYNCPGLAQLPSDTLDNRLPIGPTILSASVVNGNEVELSWLPSTSPEVVAYVIYRETTVGAVPIDTISGTNYLDVNADAANQSEQYYVLSLDACGNNSLFQPPFGTILMDGEVLPCEQAFLMDFNSVGDDSTRISRYEIWASENGGPFEQVGIAPATATNYSFGNLNSGSDYCVLARGFLTGSASFSASNQVCFTADVIRPMRSIQFSEICTNADNTVDLAWNWTAAAEITSFDILANGVPLFSETMPMQPFPAIGAYTAAAADLVAPIRYGISTVDACDTVFLSGVANSIVLTASTPDQDANQLTWTPFNVDNAILSTYQIFKQVANQPLVLLATITDGAISYSDEIDPNRPLDAIGCYQIIAQGSYPDGSALKVSSNLACSAPTPIAFIPNAFVPRGTNRIFKPVIQFAEQAEYSFQVFDRYGKIIFQTDDLEAGWNGRFEDGTYALPGVYSYHIQVTPPNSSTSSWQGLVNLLW